MISIERFEGQMIYPMKSGKRYPMIHAVSHPVGIDKIQDLFICRPIHVHRFYSCTSRAIRRNHLPCYWEYSFLHAVPVLSISIQERREDDRRMERTKDRPIPSGKLRPHTALLISIGLILSGSLILFYGTNLMAWGLGLFAMVWYNGVYTYLKRKSAFAAIPGALVGSIPPLVGWISWKGHLSFDPQILPLLFSFLCGKFPISGFFFSILERITRKLDFLR